MVKSKVVSASAGKTKNLKQVTSSDDSDKSSEESEVLKSKSKKIPSIKSKSRHQASDSSSEEPKHKQKAKKISKKRYESESESSEEVVKRKKKHQDSSEESEDVKKRSKKAKKSKTELKKGAKKRKDSSSSEEVRKSKKKANASESESEDKPAKAKKSKKPLDSDSEAEVPKKKSKGKKAESSDEEPQKKSLKPASKPSAPKRKLDSSSEEADPYDSKALKSVQKPAAVAKLAKPAKEASSSSAPSSPNSVHSSDEEEQNLVLTKGKSSQKAKPAEALPFKRPNPDPVVKVRSAEPSAQAAPQSADSQFAGTDIELFVGGLAYEAGEEDLRALFSKYGEIERISIPHRDGSPSGIAFISFTSPQSAQSALVLNNTQFMSRNLRISFSSGKKSKPSGPAGGFSSSRPAAAGGSSTVFVGNIPYTANEDLLQDFFSQCGDIKQVRLAKLPTGELKGFAHVEFYELDSANKAVALAGQPIEGRAIKVELSAPKVASGPRGGDMGGRPARPVSQNFAGQKIRL